MAGDKTCTVCGELKRLSEFHNHKKTIDGKNSRCIDCARKAASKWYAENKEKKRKYDERRRKEKRFLYRSASKRWRESNPDKKKVDTNCRRRRMRRQMPVWVKPVDMACFYEQSQRVSYCLGTRFVVDHIIPIKGDGVRGLHAPINLQVIPESINAIKSNHYERIPEGWR